MSESIKGFKNDYAWLSNFTPVPVLYDGITYPSVEHAYVAAKLTNPAHRELIKKATAGTAKKLGRTLPIRKDWDCVKYDIMKDLLIQKFSNPKFSELLLSTGDSYIEETNWWGDVYWGVCNGVGKNNLGKLIMEIREDLRGIHGDSGLLG